MEKQLNVTVEQIEKIKAAISHLTEKEKQEQQLKGTINRTIENGDIEMALKMTILLTQWQASRYSRLLDLSQYLIQMTCDQQDGYQVQP